MSKTPYIITIAGTFQQGKSTLVNCLLEKKFAETGNGLRTTACNTVYRYGTHFRKQFIRHDGKIFQKIPDGKASFHPDDRVEVELPHDLLKNVTLIDTPGRNANAKDDEMAEKAIENTDAILLLLAEKTIGNNDREILEKCREKNKRVILLFNCKNLDNWHPAEKQNQEICEVIDAQVKNAGFDHLRLEAFGQNVFPCNLHWAWCALGLESDKKISRLYPELDTPAKLEKASGIQNIRHAIHNFPSILAWDFMSNMDREIEQIISNLEEQMDKIIQETAKKWIA